jgi:hypothetical protein
LSICVGSDMVCLWIGLGAAIAIVALFLFVLIINHLGDRATARHTAIRNRQYAAESAMVSAVQDTIAEMFETVRRQR